MLWQTCDMSGQHVGSLQAVKESLRRMRWRHERLSNMSMPPSNPGIHDDGGLRCSTSSAQHLHHHDRALRRIASELIQYVWSHTASDTSAARIASSTQHSVVREGEETGMCTDTRVISVAMYHQQQRAEVNLGL